MVYGHIGHRQTQKKTPGSQVACSIGVGVGVGVGVASKIFLGFSLRAYMWFNQFFLGVKAVPRGPPIWIWIFDSAPRFGV